MNLDEHERESANWIMALEWAVDAADKERGRLIQVDADNYYELLLHADIVARALLRNN